MEAVIAGWTAGYAMSILSTAALVFLFVKMPDMGAVRRWFPDMSPTLLAVPASIGTMFAWTMAGIVIASVYDVLELRNQSSFLGAPSAPFLIAMGALGLMPLPVLLLVARRYWWLWCGMSFVFVGLFGWFMPIAAER